ncbi:MAG: helix-turn-helix transcriptional regulator [Candidatus Syntropharchaeia archaeon]
MEERILEMIQSSNGGILQTDLWKRLGIDFRTCSRILVKLEAEGLIKREWAEKTFRIIYIQDREENYGVLVAGKLVAPCIGCSERCLPEKCALLDEWIQNLLGNSSNRS